jgi:hypothetical protein
MFNSLSVSLNGKPVTFQETNYHYKAYLEQSSDASSKHLVSRPWYLDSSQELEENNGYTTRLKYVSKSQTVELYGRLHADLFNYNRILLTVLM